VPDPPINLDELSEHCRFVEFVIVERLTVAVKPLIPSIIIVEFPLVVTRGDKEGGLAEIE